MNRTLRLYPYYRALRGLVFWMAVFFLYYQERLTVGEALWLEAVYYTAFVLLEVPSGYLSDAVGRRPTLIAGSLLYALGAVAFALGDGFAPWALGQLLFAAGFAFDSGTDQSLLYDTLAAEGREDEFGELEARASAWNLVAVAVASLAGGMLGAVDLRLPYVASAVSAVVAMGIAMAFTEPPRAKANPPSMQLANVGRALRHPMLRWVTGVAFAGTVLNHVPYEFHQPWLAELVGEPTQAALWAGATSFVIVALSAMAAARANRLAKRSGAEWTLLGALGLQTLVIGAMSASVSWWILPLTLLRGVPGAVLRPVMGAVQHPLLSSDIRATTLSVQSLGGRLSFGLTLLVAGQLAHDSMQRAMIAYAILAIAIVTFLALSRPTSGSAR
ncbi:MAG: MFS transporter [Deltaproteobacteria bacterium]|nr:MAG: MFS transporter [Deltaproteobacteria bacterium]